jgi:uncharacterized protein with HEPN domain
VIRKLSCGTREAAELIAAITDGKTFDEFDRDVVLRSAVDRQFEIVGEALAQLTRLDAATAARIPDLREVIGFRNLLIHGYAFVDRARVWQVVEENLPQLRAVLVALLAESP